ncbi:hypothetical protein DFS34DRAFT_310848 [Phlyctochytrium arcticum]|nr:hypothetical protein DFS34DRAFT_310848 [Phlyctochytrium arcticum]
MQGGISTVARRSHVGDEADVLSKADQHLHDVLEDILQSLGLPDYWFRNIGGSETIGSPDKIFYQRPATNPMLTIEFKTSWGFPRLNDPVAAYHAETNLEGKIHRAINQMYGYMTFNHTRYGVLTTYDNTYFLKRVYSELGGHLEVSGPFTFDSANPYTVIEAYTTLLLLTIEDWFYVSPPSSASSLSAQ